MRFYLVLMQLPQSSVWATLKQQQQLMQQKNMRDLFACDHDRCNKFSLDACGLFLDYSKNRIDDEIMRLLIQLATDRNVAARRDAMFAGKIINTTEQRAVLHTALRNPDGAPVIVDGKDVMPEIRAVLEKIKQCTESIRKENWRGFSDKPIKSIVNIGIGGSDLGPAMVVAALTPYAAPQMSYHFVSNIDATHIAEALKNLDPETTLFLVASKTFTTQETLCNANTAKDWLLKNAPNKALAIKRHFIAITAKPERAIAFGIDGENIFPFWDWVGGRYSLWSAIGLSIAIAIGFDNFMQLLAGAHAMDEHFRNADFRHNMPIILALLGIWHINFWNLHSQAVIPYDQYLHLLPSFLQQLDMESNGKRVQINGEPVNYATAPVIWGSVGTNGQHAFHQLLLQGMETIPIDFILPIHSHNPMGKHQLLLYANCLAQSQALMQGKSEQEVIAELQGQGMTLDDARKLAPHKIIPGNIPNNVILTDKITPFTLGALIALYEHKVFVQGVIWNINSFDQWGVELGKQLAKNIVAKLESANAELNFDCSTNNLIKKYL